jgi:hypothetical protein
LRVVRWAEPSGVQWVVYWAAYSAALRAVSKVALRAEKLAVSRAGSWESMLVAPMAAHWADLKEY